MKNLILFSIFIISFKAHAGFFIDPFVGFDSTTVVATPVGGTASSSPNSGIDYGARLGFRMGKAFWIAGEVINGSGEESSSTSTSTSEYTRSMTNFLLGYDMGRYNLSLGYGLSDRMNNKSYGVEVSGTNVKFGVAYDAANHVSTNMDFIVATYTKAGGYGNEIDIASVYDKFQATSIIVSISFPFGDYK